jgi:hypothetical protein
MEYDEYALVYKYRKGLNQMLNEKTFLYGKGTH